MRRGELGRQGKEKEKKSWEGTNMKKRGRKESVLPTMAPFS